MRGGEGVEGEVGGGQGRKGREGQGSSFFFRNPTFLVPCSIVLSETPSSIGVGGGGVSTNISVTSCTLAGKLGFLVGGVPSSGNLSFLVGGVPSFSIISFNEASNSKSAGTCESSFSSFPVSSRACSSSCSTGSHPLSSPPLPPPSSPQSLPAPPLPLP